ncbi:translational activator of GCN4, partial [Blyttiomyces sp. JEL0837]
MAPRRDDDDDDYAEDDDNILLDSQEDIEVPSPVNVDLPWPEYISDVLSNASTTSSDSLRTHAVRGISLKLKNEVVPDTLIPQLLSIMMITVPRFHTGSRKVVLNALVDLYTSARKATGDATDNLVVRAVCRLFEKELKSSLSALPATTLFNYLKWTSKLIEVSIIKKPLPSPDLTKHPKSPAFKTLLNLHASILEGIASQSHTGESGNKKSSDALTFQAVKLTRRFMLLGKAPAVEAVMETIVKEPLPEGKDGFKLVVMLGSAIDVATHKGYSECIEKRKELIAKLYEKAILGAKTPPAELFLTALAPFFAKFMTPEVLEKQILANAERLIVRSSEVILRTFQKLFDSITFDISKLFREKFADSLLNQMKSSSEVVRHDAIQLFSSLSSKCTDGKETSQVVDIVIKGFSTKSPNADQKLLFYTALAALPKLPEVSNKIVTSIPALAQKETTEAPIKACLNAIGPHLNAILTSANPDAAVITGAATFLTTGLNDSKSFVRRAYMGCLEANVVGGGLAVLSEKSLLGLVEAVLKIIDKIQTAGIAMLDPKKESPLLSEGYVGVDWIFGVMESAAANQVKAVGTLLESKKFIAHLLSSNAQKNWFFNEKLYGKLLLTAEDQMPFVK